MSHKPRLCQNTLIVIMVIKMQIIELYQNSDTHIKVSSIVVVDQNSIAVVLVQIIS